MGVGRRAVPGFFSAAEAACGRRKRAIFVADRLRTGRQCAQMDFNRYISATEFQPLADVLRKEGRPVAAAKGSRIVSQQHRTHLCGIVEEGAFRYLHLADDGREHIVGYAFEGEFVGDYVSMRIDRPATVTIEAMCDSRIVMLPLESLEAFYRSDAEHERLGRHLAEHLTAELYERLLERYSLSAQARYEKLISRCPRLFEVASLKEIASYLGVRPETLSRIRRRSVH